MADSLYSTLLSAVDRRNVSSIAGALGESEHSVSRGIETSIAATLAGMASKADNPGMLRRILDLAVPGDISLSQVAGSITDPNSPLMSAGRRLLSTVFGTSEAGVTDAISRDSGMRPAGIVSLLGTTALMVVNFISRKMRDEGMTISDLGNRLQQEAPAIRNALPGGLADMLWPRPGVTAAAAAPGTTRPVRRETSSSSWLAALAIAAALLGLFWLLAHARRPAVTGTAARVGTPNASLGEFVRVKLPDNVNLVIPQRGVESRLLMFIQDPNARVDQNTWFDFDRVLFDPDSATIRPESEEQLNNIAEILKAYPNVHVKVGGYTDNSGDPQHNLQLSQDRANAVVAEEVHRGIAPDRLTAEGYGDQHAVADNSTDEGRAKNRRMSLRVTQK